MDFPWDKKKLGSVRLSKLLSEIGVVYHDFKAVQPSGDRFLLLGSIDFNEVTIKLESGTIRFRLRGADLIAECNNCEFDPDSIAFRKKGRDSVTEEASRSDKFVNEKSHSGKISGSISAGLTEAPSAKLSAKGSKAAEGASVKTRSSVVAGEIDKPLVEANLGRAPSCISWRIEPDPCETFHTNLEGEAPANCLNGQRLADAEGGLGAIDVSNKDHSVKLSLEIRTNDVLITEFTANEKSPLLDLEKKLLETDNNKEIVGRMAVQRAISGSLLLKKLSHPSMGDGDE